MPEHSRPVSQRPGHAPSWRRTPVCLLWLTLIQLIPAAAQATPKGEFLVFPNINSISRQDELTLNGQKTLPRERTIPSVDFFFSRDFERLRVIAEFFASSSDDHGAHFERLQLGWHLPLNLNSRNPDSRNPDAPDPDSGNLDFGGINLWAGRFHNPLGYWNTQYHHGSYLETAITRPGSVAYESSGGILPMHLAGLLLEGSVTRGEAMIGYDLAVGLGPELSGAALEELNILNPDSRSKPVLTLRLNYHPLEDDPTQYGLSFSNGTIPDNLGGDIRQATMGAHANWETGRLRLLGALYYVRNEITAGGRQTFASGYLQAEWPLALRWTLFSRLEDSRGDKDDGYLTRIPLFVRARQLGGIRFELTDRQALKLELSNTRYLGHHSEAVRFQWSAVFP